MDLVQNNINIEKPKIKIESAKPNLSKRVQKVMKHFAKRNRRPLTKQKDNYLINITGRCYNTISWLMTQWIDLKNEIYFPKKVAERLKCINQKTPKSCIFPKIHLRRKQPTQEDQ